MKLNWMKPNRHKLRSSPGVPRTNTVANARMSGNLAVSAPENCAFAGNLGSAGETISKLGFVPSCQTRRMTSSGVTSAMAEPPARLTTRNRNNTKSVSAGGYLPCLGHRRECSHYCLQDQFQGRESGM